MFETLSESSSAIADLKLDLRYACRALRRTPGFTLVALLTLALGIGAATAMFSVLDAAWRRSLPFAEAEKLVLGRTTFSGRVGRLASMPDLMDIRLQSTTLESLSAIGAGVFPNTITGQGEPAEAWVTSATSDLFRTLGVIPHLGRFSDLEELPEGGGGEVVISHEFWQRWFGGSRDALNTVLTVNGNPLTVVGVLPPGFHFFYDADLWLPPWAGASAPLNRRYHNWITIGRLAPGAGLEAAQAEVDAISARLAETYPDSNQEKGLRLEGLRGAMVEGYSQSLLVLAGAIVFVLLIACGNVANLMLARGSTRRSELALRNALGATRARLTRQLLTECGVLAMAAGCMGIVVAVWLQDLILGFVSMDRLGLRDVGLSPVMFLIAVALSLATILIFGVFPSHTASRTDPGEDLKTSSRRTTPGGGIRYRSGLVVLQVALSVVLLAGAGLLIRSYVNLRGADPGFRVKNLLTATVLLPADRYEEGDLQIRFFRSLRERIERLPGVESVAVIDRLPILQTLGNVALWLPENPPATKRDALKADRRMVMPGYFSTMEIPLLEGRAIAQSDRADSPKVIVLNRAAAEALFGGESAVGRHVEVDLEFLEWDEPAVFEVVGVVENHQLSSLGGRMRTAMFFPFEQQPRPGMRLAVAAAIDPSTLTRPIQESIWELDGDIVLSNPQTMEHALASSVAYTRSVTTVLVLFAVVALALAALGLHGVLAFFVAQRVHEIGIRVALGASRPAVLRLILIRGMQLVGSGVVVGTITALGATRLVQGMLYQISAIDPVSLAAAAGLFVVVALGACLVPAWNALRVQPMEALRVD